MEAQYLIDVSDKATRPGMLVRLLAQLTASAHKTISRWLAVR